MFIYEKDGQTKTLSTNKFTAQLEKEGFKLKQPVKEEKPAGKSHKTKKGDD